MIITRTPFRVSFFGGGTDYPPWFREHGGSVLATTIDKYCYISLRHLPPFFQHKHRIVYSQIENVREISEIEHPAVRAVFNWANVNNGIEVHHDGDLPAKSGLGSSSSFTVGIINALQALEGKRLSKKKLAEYAIHIEQDLIKENVGSQDQISAAFGGFNKIDFHRNGCFDVSPVLLRDGKVEELEKHLMLFFTGFSRIASEVAASKIANLKFREVELKQMHAMVNQAVEILQSPSESICEFGKLLNQSWQIKRQLSDRVSTPQIDNIYDASMKAGAIGGKILGAGGGGFFLVFAEPEKHQAIRNALSGLVHVPFKFDNSGSKVVLYQPDGL